MYCTKLKMIRWYLYKTCLPTQCILGKLGQKQIRSIVRDLNDFTIQPYMEEALARFFCSLKLVKFYSKVIIFVCFKWFSKRDGERKSEFFGKFRFAFLSEFVLESICRVFPPEFCLWNFHILFNCFLFRTTLSKLTNLNDVCCSVLTLDVQLCIK